VLVKVHGIVQRIWPKGKVDHLGPADMRVKQLLAPALQEVSDGFLGNAILEVGVHPTKGELLSRVVACLFEGNDVKLPIVTVIVEDFDFMFSRILLECKLGREGFG
jgi:hypothetical protein